MPAAPPNQQTQRSARTALPWVVLLGDTQGNRPTDADEVDFLRPLEIVRTAGGRTEDYCTFAYDLGKTGEHLQDLQSGMLRWNRLVEVRVVTGYNPDFLSGGFIWRPLFFGELLSQTIRIGGKGEQAVITARVAEYLYGTPLDGERQWDPVGEQTLTVPKDVEFNPVVDGSVQHNRSDRTVSAGGYYHWIEPDAVRTDRAKLLVQNTTVGEWTYASAVQALCGAMNADEDHVKNPVGAGAPIWAGAPALRNVTLNRGDYLPDYLDELLTPAGYGWCLQFQQEVQDDGTLRTVPQIKVYRRGEGPKKVLRLQAIGELFDPALTDLEETEISTDIGDLATEIVAEGGWEQRELTLELYRGWPEADDALPSRSLQKSDPEGDFATHQSAWRLWVANEAGDYTDSRSDIITTPDFTGVFNQWIPGRREPEDCLTKDESGKRRPPFVEWYDGSEWKPVPSEWGITIVNDEIAVLFTGDTPPEDLVDAGDDARLRITCTVSGDSRISYTASLDADTQSTPNGRTVRQYLDVADRFPWREVQEDGGVFASELAGDPNGADEVDEATALAALTEYADRLLDSEYLAAMSCELVLHGIDLGYEIGDVLTRIDGRGINLSRQGKPNRGPYVQVTGIRLDRQSQRTTLSVEAVT